MSCSQAHYRSHQEGFGKETQIKNSEEWTPCSRPSQGYLRRASAPMSTCDTYHKESTLELLLNCKVATVWYWSQNIGEEHLGIAQDLLWGVLGGTKGGERGGFRWFGEEFVWENKGVWEKYMKLYVKIMKVYENESIWTHLKVTINVKSAEKL